MYRIYSATFYSVEENRIGNIKKYQNRHGTKNKYSTKNNLNLFKNYKQKNNYCVLF